MKRAGRVGTAPARGRGRGLRFQYRNVYAKASAVWSDAIALPYCNRVIGCWNIRAPFMRFCVCDLTPAQMRPHDAPHAVLFARIFFAHVASCTVHAVSEAMMWSEV